MKAAKTGLPIYFPVNKKYKEVYTMDNIIVAVIMISMIIVFVIGAIIAQKKGNSGFASAVKYDERLVKKDEDKTEDKDEIEG